MLSPFWQIWVRSLINFIARCLELLSKVLNLHGIQVWAVILHRTSFLAPTSGNSKLGVKRLSQLASFARMSADRFIEEFPCSLKAIESRDAHEPGHKR